MARHPARSTPQSRGPHFAGPPVPAQRPPDVIDLPRITRHDHAVLRALAGEAETGIDLAREAASTLPYLFFLGLADLRVGGTYHITDTGRQVASAAPDSPL